MSHNNDLLPSNDLFLLTLKGPVTIHFLDGKTVSGEITAQDQLNIFVMVKGEPVLIPRRQVRFIKGQVGQQVERDDSQRRFAPAQPKRPEERTVEGLPATVASEAAEEDDMTLLLDSEEEPEDMTVFLDAADDDDDDETAFIVEEEDDEDQTVFFSQENDDTLLVEEETPPVVTAYLECTTGPHTGEKFELQSGVTSLGRSSDNIFALSKDKEISRRHALITYEESKFLIEDRGSLNGVIINDVRIDGTRQLQPGDTILLGISTLVFHEQ